MSIDRRKFMATAGLSAMACCMGKTMSPSLRPPPQEKPNLLFVFADQLRSMELGCYGGTGANTPNLDRLAREGCLYSNAVSTYPVCSPYRAMLMSGNMPMKNGMISNDHLMRNPTPCIAEVFRDNGYQTGYIGKWHIDGRGRNQPIPEQRRLGFDFWRGYECTHNYFNSNYFHQNETTPRQWEDYDALSQTNAACDFIGNNPDPFCLFLSWGPPHDPYIAPQAYMDRFNPDELHLRENVDHFEFAEAMWANCTIAAPPTLKDKRVSAHRDLRDPSNQSIRKWTQGYLAALEVLDDCMGKLLLSLERNGQLDNTIIVFTSDHGDMLGSHRQIGKQTPFEESLSVPFIVRYPPKVTAARSTDTLLTPVDIMPTLLSLAGLPLPGVDGIDLSRSASANLNQGRSEALIMKMTHGGNNWLVNGTPPWRGVRSQEFTYARRSDTHEPWLLFDLKADPLQVQNLVHEPRFRETVAYLDKRTDELLREYKDPEDPILLARRVIEERKAIGRRIVHTGMFVPKQMPPGYEFSEG